MEKSKMTSKKIVVHFEQRKTLQKSFMSKNLCEYTDVLHSSFMHYFNLYFSGVTVIHIDSNLSHRVGELDFSLLKYKIRQRWWGTHL